MDKLIEILTSKKLTISLVESCTGGLLSYYFTQNAGASRFFKGSIIAYNNTIKRELLKVSNSIIENDYVVSKTCAIEMVRGLKSLIDSDIYVSVTGNAGPTHNKPELEGITYYSIYYKEKIYTSMVKCKNMERMSVQLAIVKTIIQKLITILNQ